MKRLFIVEDEAIIAMDLAEQLEEFGYDVVGVAHDSDSALEQLEDLDPDLILMDIVLGSGPDGIETAEQILHSRSLPIIFLTAFSDPATVERAAKTAPYGYITKPYNSQALRASIEIALSKHQLEHRLLYKERWFSNILHAVHDGIIAVGIDGRIHFANDEACRILKLQNAAELIDQPVSDLIICDNNGERLQNSPVATAMQQNVVMPITFGGSLRTHTTGHRCFVDYTAAPVRGDGNSVIGGLLAFRDASQRLNIESAIRNSDGRFEAAFSQSSVGVALVAFNNDLIEANPAFCRLFEYSGSKSANFLSDLLPEENDRLKIQEGQMMLLAGQQANIQHECTLPASQDTGEPRHLLINITLLHDDHSNPSYYFCQVYDLTDRKNAERKLYHLANYDVVTGLINQAQLQEEVSQCLEHCQHHQTSIAVITLDIDNFKAVNDRYGLDTGNKLLGELALRFKDMAYFNQIIGRPGGDRFCIVLHSLESINQAMFVASRALEELSEPCFIGKDEIRITGCAGISIAPEDGITPSALMTASNEALQVAKSNGIGQISFYNTQFSEIVKGRIRHEVNVIQALEQNHFELYAQPLTKTEADKERPDSVRVFNYWPEKDQFLEAVDFIDIADHSGLAKKTTLQMMHHICTLLCEIPEQKHPQRIILPYYPAIRHSAEIVPVLQKTAEDFGLPAHLFVFELHGNANLQNLNSPKQTAEFRKAGFALSLNLPEHQPTPPNLICQLQPEFYMVNHHDSADCTGDCLRATLAMVHTLGVRSVLYATDIQPEFRNLFDYGLASGSRPQPLDKLIHP